MLVYEVVLGLQRYESEWILKRSYIVTVINLLNVHSSVVLEACVETINESMLAEQRGASRLELCANLDQDGTTPDEKLIKDVLHAVQIPVKVMIRPRGGNFVYNREEFENMLHSIEKCQSLGVSEIVTGILRPDNSLDVERIRQLATAAAPMSVTIHKCIDLVPDIFEAIKQLKRIPGIRSVLSSGKADNAIEGTEVLRQMLPACGERLTLIVAGKVTQENLKILVRDIGTREYHGRKIV